jgi:hypothetical protein
VHHSVTGVNVAQVLTIITVGLAAFTTVFAWLTVRQSARSLREARTDRVHARLERIAVFVRDFAEELDSRDLLGKPRGHFRQLGAQMQFAMFGFGPGLPKCSELTQEIFRVGTPDEIRTTWPAGVRVPTIEELRYSCQQARFELEVKMAEVFTRMPTQLNPEDYIDRGSRWKRWRQRVR